MDDLSEQTVITDELKPPAPKRKISLWRRLQWLLRRLRTKLVIGWEKFLYLIMPKKSRLHRNKLSPSEKKLRRIKTWRTIALVFCGLVVLGIIVFLVMFFWFSKDLPQPGEVIRREGYSSKIY
ncbi:MAG TPA: hypothetical protein PLJ02_01395, partial [Candidatus Woesebacteria bacterium]|nr:hypothetical protein [Candidatus Woesebacteria bacterium]